MTPVSRVNGYSKTPVHDRLAALRAVRTARQELEAATATWFYARTPNNLSAQQDAKKHLAACILAVKYSYYGY